MSDALILVVEDEAITAMDIKGRLEDLGYHVPTTVATGEEAIEIAKSLTPDLILMDIMLKGPMNGIEAGEFISSHYKIPIIFLTAFNDDNTFNRAKEASPYSYLCKPFEFRDLKFSVELALFKHKKEIEIALAEKRYSALIDNATCGFIIYDRNGEIIEVNKQAEKILGREKKSLLGTVIHSYFNNVETKEHNDYLSKLFSRNIPVPTTVQIFQPDGQAIEVEYTDVTNMGTEPCFMRILNDVTVTKKLKEQNNLLIELENANLAKNKFLASMSHELRTPLNSIIGFTGTLLMKIPGEINEEQEKQLSIVKKSANHLLTLINELLDLAKIESGKVNLNFEDVELIEHVQHIIQSLMPLASAKNLTLLWNPGKDKIIIKTDKRALTQILMNLISNAIKYTEQGQVRVEYDKSRHAIQVIDTGIGIRPEDQKKLFQAYMSLADPNKQTQSTGLGLHLSMKLAQLIKGKIECESEFGKGSCFTLVLPE